MSRCPNCMNELVNRNCSNCGYPLIEAVMVRDALQVGTLLNDRYELGNALGNSVQSIAYIAFDQVNAEPVIILEFYPKSVVTRKFNDVTIRGNRELYIDANRMFLTSDKLQALAHLDSFAQNNTVYRVYRLNGHSALAGAEAELLLDDPILFRNNIGKPTMSINALPIPQMPRARKWTLSSRIQSERKRRLMRNCLIGVLVCAVAALAGFFTYDAMRMHPMTITVKTDSDIKAAQFAGNALPYATPNANGEVSYAVTARKGEYTFSAENMKQMKVEQQMSVGKEKEYTVAIPLPTATPIPDIKITSEQWLLSTGDKYYVADKATGEITQSEGKPDSNISLVSVSVNADESFVKTLKREKIYLKSGNAEYELSFSGGKAEVKVSAGEYEVILYDGKDKKELKKISAAANSRIQLHADAIEFYLENIKTLGENEEVFFVGGECNQKAFATTSEELNSWADEYPELFDCVRQYPLEIELSDAINEKVDIEINGLEWKNGYKVTVSKNVNEINAVISQEEISYPEKYPVYKDAAITIGSKTKDDVLEDSWLKAEKIICAGEWYTLIQDDGSRTDLAKSEFDKARELFKGAFAKENLNTWTRMNLTIAKDVNRDYIARVTIDGKEIPKNEEDGYSADVTPGKYHVEVEFTNGLEAAGYDVMAEGNQMNEELLRDRRLIANRLNNELKRSGICSIIETDNGFAWLPKGKKISEEPETIIKLSELFTEVFDSVDNENWRLAPVDIYINDAIDTDCISAITVNGETVPESTEGYGAYAALKATKYDKYELRVVMEDEKTITSTEKAETEPGTPSGRNEWYLLDDLADEKLDSLSYWGYSEDDLELRAGDTKYLKQEFLDQAMDEAEIFSLTVKGAQMNEWIRSYRIRSTDPGEDKYLEPEVTEENEFVVYMTRGEYNLMLLANGNEEENLLLEDPIELVKDTVIILEDGHYPEEMFAALATPAEPTPAEPTPEEPTPAETEPEEPKHKHIPVKAETVSPTCKDKGYTVYRCDDKNCTYNYKGTYVDPDPKYHKWDEGTKNEIDGTITFTCEYCKETKIETSEDNTSQPPVLSTPIEPDKTTDCSNHTEEIIAAVDPTCTETGLTEGKKCSVCKKVLVEQETIRATGHTEVVDAAVAATCTTDGKTEGTHCSVCKKVLVEQETILATGHDEEILAAVAPTCRTAGLTEGKKCSLCKTVLVEQTKVPVDPNAHQYEEKKEWPLFYKQCTICGYIPKTH